MEIKNDKVIMEFSEYINLMDKFNNLNDINDNYLKENHKLNDRLNIYINECKILHKKLRDEKRKFYRNRKLFEELIDLALSTIDEDLLKKSTNLSYKTAKKEILKMYDEDIKHN